MPGVFISYRRNDSSGYAGRLFDILSHHFGQENTFMDLDTIEGGDDFRAVIAGRINLADVLVAVIGPQWLTTNEKNGGRRLDSVNDFVRTEIAMALKRGIRVIPVLVGGAIMPRAEELPDELRALCQRQAVEIRDSHFHPDAERLTNVLKREVHGVETNRWKSNRLILTLLAGIGIVVVLAGFLLLYHAKPQGSLRASDATEQKKLASITTPSVPNTADQSNEPPKATKSSVDLAGKWKASVKYDWGETYDTIFDFEVDGSTVSGMAGYGADTEGDGRTILNGKLVGNRISFTTKSFVTRGFNEPNAEESHHYKGTVEGESIRFTIITDSVYPHSPVLFTAHRVKPGSLRK